MIKIEYWRSDLEPRTYITGFIFCVNKPGFVIVFRILGFNTAAHNFQGSSNSVLVIVFYYVNLKKLRCRSAVPGVPLIQRRTNVGEEHRDKCE